jgi:hypothetical protein
MYVCMYVCMICMICMYEHTRRTQIMIRMVCSSCTNAHTHKHKINFRLHNLRRINQDILMDECAVDLEEGSRSACTEYVMSVGRAG